MRILFASSEATPYFKTGGLADVARSLLAGQLAAIERHHPDADTTDLRRDLRAAGAEEYVRGLVDGFPPLTAEQRARLAVLLHTPGSGPGGS